MYTTYLISHRHLNRLKRLCHSINGTLTQIEVSFILAYTDNLCIFHIFAVSTSVLWALSQTYYTLFWFN